MKKQSNQNFTLAQPSDKQQAFIQSPSYFLYNGQHVVTAVQESTLKTGNGTTEQTFDTSPIHQLDLTACSFL